MNVARAARKAVRVFVQNPLIVLLSVCVDMGALILFGFFSASVYDKLTEHSIIIGTLVSRKMQSARGKSVLRMLFEADTIGYVQQLVFLLLLLLFIVYAFFVLSQSITIMLAKRADGEKTTVAGEVKKLAKGSAWWSLTLAVMYGLYLVADVRTLVLHKMFPQEANLGVMQVLHVVSVLLMLVAVHHLMGGRMKWFLNERKIFVMSCLVLVTLFFVIDVFLRFLGTFAFELMVLGGILFVFPLVTLMRLFLKEVVRINGVDS